MVSQRRIELSGVQSTLSTDAVTARCRGLSAYMRSPTYNTCPPPRGRESPVSDVRLIHNTDVTCFFVSEYYSRQASWRYLRAVTWYDGGGPGAMVKAACLGSRRSRVRLSLWHLVFKETTIFFHAHSERFNIVRGFRDHREVTCSASDCQDSNPVSGGQCQLIHLTILKRCPWPRLAHIGTNWA